MLGGEEPPRRGQLRAADTGGHAGFRVHQLHEEGQVPCPRGERRHSVDLVPSGCGAVDGQGEGGGRVCVALAAVEAIGVMDY